MKFVKVLLAGIGLVVVVAASSPSAGAAEYPRVSNLRAFSAEANYMSLPGYLRYLVFVRDGIWLSRQEAMAIVDRQIATGE